MSSDLQSALQSHLADPDDPATALAFFDAADAASPTEVQEAVNGALLGRQPAPVVTKQPVAPGPIGGPPPADPAPESVPQANWAGNIPLSGAALALKVASQAGVEAAITQTQGQVDPSRRFARALGTAHSSSPIVQTAGVIVDTGVLEGTAPTGGLRALQAIDPAKCLPGVDTSALIWVGAGLHVEEVAEGLDKLGRALP